MSHDIDSSTGKAGIAYVGDVPWHGLGTQIKQGASAKEILRAAVLNWKVNRSIVQFSQEGKTGLAQDLDHQVIYRSDTGAVLDVTGKKYIPHQNSEVMDFFQEYVAAGDMFIDVAGSLNGGKQIWVLAKMQAQFNLPGKDNVGGYVLLMNPHQYGKGMIAKMTAIRVVCQNTLTAALGAGGASIKVWHTKEFNQARQQEAKEKLGIAKERFDAFKTDATTLSKTKIDMKDAVKIFAQVTGGDPTDSREDQSPTVRRLADLFEGQGMGADLQSALGTGWGALNAVTQWVDHEYGRSPNARLNNAWLGRGEQMKRQAMALLLEQAA